jgi:hypothetical protein
MQKTKISEKFEALTDTLKRYIGLRLELIKCVLAEALARLGAIMLIVFVFSLLAFLVLFFISFAFVDWYAEYFHHAYIGALIVALFYVVVGVIIYLLRERIFLNPLISVCSRILIEQEDDEKE